MEKLFDALQCPGEWKVDFVVFYLKDKAVLWWALCERGILSLGSTRRVSRS